jgi:hypothetical protein
MLTKTASFRCEADISNLSAAFTTKPPKNRGKFDPNLVSHVPGAVIGAHGHPVGVVGHTFRRAGAL